ncbi:unnamed protein product [Strongylus vulgaris]|uniref:Uncharacterized protein n=1 Tax=Strongylus vulgaris TaxID=40348 RepID=A0A3P7JC27_STRVU|nr:unnamed protein product [Strongylus vulgaris]
MCPPKPKQHKEKPTELTFFYEYFSCYSIIPTKLVEMMCPPKPKQHKEKPTELLRLHLERTGVMDALTSWLKNVVELPADKRPPDAQEYLKMRWNSWSGNIVASALENSLEDIKEEVL